MEPDIKAILTLCQGVMKINLRGLLGYQAGPKTMGGNMPLFRYHMINSVKFSRASSA